MSSLYEWRLGEEPPVLGEHSLAKHDIFEQYLGIYIDRLTRTPSQTILNLTIVDGFSGGGLYRFRSEEVEGSPVRLLRAVETADRNLDAGRAKGFSIRADFFFVDENAEHVDYLRDLLARRGYGPRLGQDIFLA
jgi:three-Cys-motif partner protein